MRDILSYVNEPLEFAELEKATLLLLTAKKKRVGGGGVGNIAGGYFTVSQQEICELTKRKWKATFVAYIISPLCVASPHKRLHPAN